MTSNEKDVLMASLPFLEIAASVMKHPIFGIAATFMLPLLSGFLSTTPDYVTAEELDRKLETLQENIMKDVNEYIKKDKFKTAVQELRLEVYDFMQEIAWVPGLLSSTQSQQTKAAYFLVLQTHLAALNARVYKRKCMNHAIKRGKEHAKRNVYSVTTEGVKWECKEWAETGLGFMLGMQLANLQLDALKEIFQADSKLQNGIKKKMKQVRVENFYILSQFFFQIRNKIEKPKAKANAQKAFAKWAGDNICVPFHRNKDSYPLVPCCVDKHTGRYGEEDSVLDTRSKDEISWKNCARRRSFATTTKTTKAKPPSPRRRSPPRRRWQRHRRYYGWR